MSLADAVRSHMQENPPMTREQCLPLIASHRRLAGEEGCTALACECHTAWAEALEGRAGKPPEDAQPGDPCGLLIATGADGQAKICDGTLDPYVEVWGPPLTDSPPLACATCLGTVP